MRNQGPAFEQWIAPSSNASSNEEYQIQLPTLQDQLIVIQADLDRLQVEWTKLEVEY